MDKFSERLVALRKEKDLTQAEFARLCGKQRTTVSGYETEGKEPDFALLCQMADYFGVTTDYLLGREDERAHGNEAFRQDNANFKRRYDALSKELLYVRFGLCAALPVYERAERSRAGPVPRAILRATSRTRRDKEHPR